MPNPADIIKQQQERLVELDKFVEQVEAMPKVPGVVARVLPDRVILSVDGKLSDVEKPADKLKLKLKTGDAVALFPSGQIVGAFPTKLVGAVALFKERLDDLRIVVSGSGGVDKVLYCNLECEPGDRLHVEGLVVLDNLGKDESAHTTDEVDVSWDDIAGLSEVKQELIEMVETPHAMAELYKQYGYNVPKGMLFSGPPGCGKTLLGKAAATSMRKVYGGKSSFIYVKGPEILNKWVGESEGNVRSIFARARDHSKKYNTPAIVFVDEAEAVLTARGHRNTSGVDQTIVPSFLTEMDGMSASGAMVILATNRPDMLDPAVVREGRIDRKFTVNRPSKKAVAEIAELNARNIKKSFSGEEVAEAVFDPLRAVFHAQGVGKNAKVLLSDMVSGAMVANIMNRAKQTALRRDVKKGLKKAGGIQLQDMVEAVDSTVAELKATSHDETIREACSKQHGFEVTSYTAI